MHFNEIESFFSKGSALATIKSVSNSILLFSKMSLDSVFNMEFYVCLYSISFSE